MVRVIFVALVVFATIYALVDCIQTNRSLVRIMPKPVWLLVCLIPVVGPIFWLVAGRSDARGGPGARPSRGGQGGPSGPLGPDDDPDFLRKLRRPKP